MSLWWDLGLLQKCPQEMWARSHYHIIRARHSPKSCQKAWGSGLCPLSEKGTVEPQQPFLPSLLHSQLPGEVSGRS